MVRRFSALMGFGAVFLLATGPLGAQDKSLGAENDCSDFSIDYQDRPDLTQAERAALMERALYRSLSKFDACQTETSSNTSSGASSGNGQGDAGGSQGRQGQESGTEGSEPQDSVATSDMKGTESEIPAQDQAQTQAQTQAGPGENAEPADPGPPGQPNPSLKNGKAPEDIPPAENDSVLEAQIRKAAENEPDPEKSRKLWNEYRRYKGLPPQ